MAWSTLPTYTSGSVLTAAQMNAIAANINETSAATVTTAGDMTYADAANSMGNRLAIGSSTSRICSNGVAPVWRTPQFAAATAASTLTTTSYADLDTLSGGGLAAVAVTATTGTRAKVSIAGQLQNATAGAYTYLSYRVSGATTDASSDNWAIIFRSVSANGVAEFGSFYWHTLTAGSNTFELQAKVSAGTGTLRRPRILVEPA